MTKQEAKNIFIALVNFGAKYSVPKSVVWGVIVAFFGTLITVSFAFVKTTDETNKAVPAYQSQTTQIQSAVTSLTLGQAEMKSNITHNTGKIKDIITKQEADHDILLEIRGILKQVNNNTK